MNYYVSSDGLTWQIAATAGIVRPVLKLVANGVDTLAFSIAGDMLASSPWAYMSTIYLCTGTPTSGLTGSTTGVLPGCTTRFVGTVTTIPRQGQGVQEYIQFTAAGGGWWLEQITYCHQWYFWNTSTNTNYALNLPRVILGQDDSGNQRNSGVEITAAVNWAISRGAPIALGTVDTLAPLPFSEHTNISCADAIKQAIRLQPDAVYWFDYSTGVPIFNCRSAANLPTPVSIAFTACTGLAMTPRFDLQLPGITIFYEITTNYNAATLRSCVADAQGTTTDPRAVSALYDLQGPTLNIQSQAIVARAYPTTAANATSITVKCADSANPTNYATKVLALTIYNISMANILVNSGAYATSTPTLVPSSSGVVWSSTTLPNNLAINASTGVVSGYLNLAAHSLVQVDIFANVYGQWVAAIILNISTN